MSHSPGIVNQESRSIRFVHCHIHLVSSTRTYGLFVPYIVDIFDCKKCHTDLVSFTKHHGLFVPYIVDIFIFLIRKSGLISPCTCHLVQGFLFFFELVNHGSVFTHVTESMGSMLRRHLLVLLTITFVITNNNNRHDILLIILDCVH